MPKTTKTRSLLDISDEMQALDDLLVEMGGDVSDEEVAKVIDGWFAEIDDDLHGKIDCYCALIQSKTLTAALRKEEAERLLKRAKTESDGAAYLKNRLHMVMQMRGLKKAGRVRTASVCGNGGKLPVHLSPIVRPQDVPARYTTVTLKMSGDAYERMLNGDINEDGIDVLTLKREFDQDAIRQALEAGEELGFAALGERGTHLRVK